MTRFELFSAVATKRRLSVGIAVASMSEQAGGLFHSVRQLSQEMLRQGHTVSVYALEDSGSRAALADWAPLRPRLFKGVGPSGARFAPSMLRSMFAADHDIIHQHGLWLPISATVNWWGHITARPVVLSPRGMLDPWALRRSPIKKWIAKGLYEGRNLRNAACIHALNREEADAVADVVPDASIVVIPNGVDMPPVPLGRPARARRMLLFLGRLHPKKGLEELIKAWSQCAPGLEGWDLTIAGTGAPEYKVALRALAEKWRIADRVRWAGHVSGPKKDRLIASCDAFVLPSKSEGQPMAVLEAMAAGKPVLMTRACNLSDTFRLGAAAEIGPDPAELASGIQTTLESGNLCRLGACARAYVTKRHAWAPIARSHLDLYQRTLIQTERRGIPA